MLPAETSTRAAIEKWVRGGGHTGLGPEPRDTAATRGRVPRRHYERKENGAISVRQEGRVPDRTRDRARRRCGRSEAGGGGRARWVAARATHLAAFVQGTVRTRKMSSK